MPDTEQQQETREQRAALIQANLSRPQIHHPAYCCTDCKPPQGGTAA